MNRTTPAGIVAAMMLAAGSATAVAELIDVTCYHATSDLTSPEATSSCRLEERTIMVPWLRPAMKTAGKPQPTRSRPSGISMAVRWQ